ncbi:MAG: leucine-rich repeat protein [Clostridia bacterium]|nr:leucine-rich repeat protein [Clostridia bacterium]
MFKRVITTLVLFAFSVSLLPAAVITAEIRTDQLRLQLSEVMESARPLLFKDNTEQTEKYLYDRYLRAEAAIYDQFATDEELYAVIAELSSGVELLAPMKGSEDVRLLSFDTLTAEDTALMTSSVGTLRLDPEHKPEDAAQSVEVTGDGVVVYDNGVTGGIAGASPFGMDMSDTDGLRLWVSVDAPSRLSLTVGKRSASDNYSLTVSDIPVSDEGYITVPYYFFIPDTDVAEIETNGLMNYIRVECDGTSLLRIAGLCAYREAVDVSKRVAYSEQKINTRGAIVDNAYYKIYTVDSYGTDSPKAITLGPIPDETALLWPPHTGNVATVDQNMSFSIEPSQEGLLTQLWQLSPDPSGNGTLRIISKASACAMRMPSAASLEFAQVDYNDIYEEFSLSAARGEFTIQVRNVGRLTYTGTTLKVTSSTAYKKFILVKVNDGEYVSTWSDEFDGDKLDDSIWQADSGFFFGGGNSALYVDSDDTAFLEDGNLILRTYAGDYNGYQSKAPHLKTNGKYAMSYGKFEIRAKMPKGMGMWPAIWLMPVDSMNMARSEIDLMEMPVQHKDYQQYGDDLYGQQIATFHWTDADGKSQWAKPLYIYSENKISLDQDYHDYAVEIDNDQVRMYFDGALIVTLNLVNDGIKFAYGDVPRYIILSSGGIQGDGSCVIYPQYEYYDREMVVDYVRVSVRREQFTDETPDFTAASSVQRASTVEYMGKNYNSFMYNFPMAISPDGTQAVMADQAGFLCVYDPRTNELLDTVSTEKYNAFLSVAYSPDGKKVAAATMTGSIIIYDTSDFSKAPVKIHNGATMQYSLCFTADSQYIVTGGFNGGAQTLKNPINNSVTEPHYVRVFNATSGAKSYEIFVESDPLSIDLSPDGTKLAVTTTSAGVFIFNTGDWSEYARFTSEHTKAINRCLFSPDGALLATADELGEVVFWSVAGKNAVSRLDTVNESSIRTLAFSPDGKYIVTNSNDTAARVYSVESGRCVSLLGGFSGIINDASYSPDGRYIVVASLDHTLKLFAADGTYISTLLQKEDLRSEGHISSRICFTPDSRYVLAAEISLPNCINRWELPESVDKSALKAAIEEYVDQDEKLENAKKVYSLKYATSTMVSAALAELTGESAEPSFRAVSISADGDTYADSAEVFRDGWIYIKAEVSILADNVFVEILNTSEESSVRIPVSQLKMGVETLDAPYESTLMRTYIEKAGSCRIRLVNADTGEVSAAVAVTVDENATTRDFLYTVNADETVTINSCKTGAEYLYIPDYIDGYPVTKIADYAFANYGRTVRHMKLRLPSTLKRIGNYSFSECASLEVLELPDGLEYIGTSAFERCLSLIYVDIPDSVKTISTSAFRYVRGTRYIKIGGGMTTVPQTTFPSTIGNRCFIFAEGVEKINSNVSDSAYLLERVYIPRSATTVNASCLRNPYYNVKVYGYPGTAAETYAATSSKLEFVPLAAPIISGVEEGETYDLYDGAVAATWNDGHVAYLNGEYYDAGKPITKPGEYTLKVVNGYDEFTTEVNFTVVDTTPLEGDADGDGVITVSDALLALRAAARLYTPTEKVTAAIDIDGDGEITVADALAILRRAVGL